MIVTSVESIPTIEAKVTLTEIALRFQMQQRCQEFLEKIFNSTYKECILKWRFKVSIMFKVRKINFRVKYDFFLQKN